MKKLTSVLALLGCTLAVSSFTLAHGKEKQGTNAAPSTQEQAKKYPLDVCVVSGDKLEDGDMGPPIDYIHKEEGKADRVVRLCCKGCIRDFKKEPAKYLKMIDDAAAGKKLELPSGHGKH